LLFISTLTSHSQNIARISHGKHLFTRISNANKEFFFDMENKFSLFFSTFFFTPKEEELKLSHKLLINNQLNKNKVKQTSDLFWRIGHFAGCKQVCIVQ